MVSLRTDLIQSALDIRDHSIQLIDPPVPDFGLAEKLPINSAAAIETYLSTSEREITALDAEFLVAKLRNRELTCESVVRAFLRRAALAQRLTNCVTELLPDQAIARARHLDALADEHGGAEAKQPLGPLHGLPISIKEHIGFEGRPTHACIVAFIGDEASTTSCRVSVVSALEAAGAVIFARTTQPQGMMQLETSSSIYGTTVNAFHRDLAAGGSSGGEGTLLGLRGSILVRIESFTRASGPYFSYF